MTSNRRRQPQGGGAELVTVDQINAELSLSGEVSVWSEDQLKALAAMGVPETATSGDLAVFHHVCVRTGLDPFAKQIHLVPRDGRLIIQTGIDGYRVVADRSDRKNGTRRSYDDFQWCGTDGVWTDVWLGEGPPVAAKVTVRVDSRPFSAVAMWREYAQTYRDNRTDQIVLTKVWRERGAGQLAKCAEALALRKAYPQDLSGLYTDDEMAQADNPGGVVEGHVEDDPDAGSLGDAMAATEHVQVDPRYAKIGDLFNTLEIPGADRHARVQAIVGRDLPPVGTEMDLTDEELNLVITELQVELPPQGES